MDWKISFEKKAEKQFEKLSKEVQSQITRYLHSRIALQPDPRLLGKGLVGEFQGLWRYRVGDYRLICEIKHDRLVILVVAVGHRSNIYS